MPTIFWVLLFGPPCLAGLTWLMTRGWTAMMMRGRSTPRIAVWQRYDFWIILTILYTVIFTAAIIEHKLWAAIRSSSWGLFEQCHWVSVDPFAGSYDLGNPQTLNRYSYVRNNSPSFIGPLGFNDSPGQDSTPSCTDQYGNRYTPDANGGIQGGSGGTVAVDGNDDSGYGYIGGSPSGAALGLPSLCRGNMHFSGDIEFASTNVAKNLKCAMEQDLCRVLAEVVGKPVRKAGHDKGTMSVSRRYAGSKN